MRRPSAPRAIQERFAPLHTFFVNKWYFDEPIDMLFVRPVAWVGRFARTTFERVVSTARSSAARAALCGSLAAVRGVQSGYLRYYAALLLLGLTGLGVYFLISA